VARADAFLRFLTGAALFQTLMCRLLVIRNARPFDAAEHLHGLAGVARESKEYQGHGWGCALLDEKKGWMLYRSLTPIWEDDLSHFGRTRFLIAHARSAYRNEGICVENNMPYFDGEHVFIFNGELQGVRIREQGRIGAEKIFNVIKRFHTGDMESAVRRAFGVIQKRTRFIRAMNLAICDRKQACIGSVFNDDPEYFTMYLRQTAGGFAMCSQPYGDAADWEPIPNHTIRVLT
jgi:glutamine amidotransferase